MKQKGIVIILLLALLLSILPAHAEASNIKLNSRQLTMGIGTTVQLTLSNVKKSITWSSDDNTIATVSSCGVVTAISNGTVNITASLNKQQYRCKVTVITIDYLNAHSFENGLENGDVIINRTLLCRINDIQSNSDSEYILRSGKYLNLRSTKAPDVKIDDTILVRITDLCTDYESWILSYELLSINPKFNLPKAKDAYQTSWNTISTYIMNNGEWNSSSMDYTITILYENSYLMASYIPAEELVSLVDIYAPGYDAFTTTSSILLEKKQQKLIDFYLEHDYFDVFCEFEPAMYNYDTAIVNESNILYIESPLNNKDACSTSNIYLSLLVSYLAAITEESGAVMSDLGFTQITNE